MRSTITITAPFAEGGVKTTIEQLKIALRSEGFEIVELVYNSYTFWKQLIYDLKSLKRLISSNAIIYAASIPQLSMIIPTSKPILLFIHGLLLHEYKNSLLYEKSGLGRIHALIYLTLFNFVRKRRGIQFICRSYTACNACGVRRNYIILPQFILDRDIEYFGKLITRHPSDKIRIVAYTSLARSPRLLTQSNIINIAKLLSRSYNGRHRIEFVIINPVEQKDSIIEMGKITLHIIGRMMPRKEFLKLVSSSTIYIDTCIDEEIRISVLEAGLMGVPVLKLVHPMYRDYLQLDEKAFIIANSIKDLVDKITYFLEDPFTNRGKYSIRIRKWVIENRHWNKVKKPLMDVLRG